VSQRPEIDVVVPFAGELAPLRALVLQLSRLDVGAADSITIVDNRPPGAPEASAAGAGVRIIRAAEQQSSYFARNRGARAGTAEWVLFIDADVKPPQDLLERYFTGARPAERTAVLAGTLIDEPLVGGARPTPAMLYSAGRASMSQANTLRVGTEYAQTANCAIRRTAFEAVGGFRGELRSGGDADICFRLRAAGWAIETREHAVAVHRSRRALRQLLRQRARHGSGAAWLEREYPGSFPRERWLGLAKWTVTSFAAAVAARARGQHDAAVMAFVEPLSMWAFELGRLIPNTTRGGS